MAISHTYQPELVIHIFLPQLHQPLEIAFGALVLIGEVQLVN
jgi:hypothetical protein